MWGATSLQRDNDLYELISIHAPRVGRDHKMLNGKVVEVVISIHAPRVGRDKEGYRLHSIYGQISIHAPRVGRD